MVMLLSAVLSTPLFLKVTSVTVREGADMVPLLMIVPPWKSMVVQDRLPLLVMVDDSNETAAGLKVTPLCMSRELD
jgi:hypothetical protein